MREDPSRGPGAGGPPHARAVALLGLLLLGGMLLRHAWVSDDAYITFRTLANLLDGRGLVWNPGERVQSFTHPLWLLLHVPFALLGARIFLVTVALSLLLTLAAWRVASAAAAPRPAAAAFLVAALACSRSFVDYGTSGLENPLTFLLLALFALRLLAPGSPAGRLPQLFLLAGLAGLNRPDTLLFYLPALLALALRGPARRVIAAAAAGLAPLAAWEAFSFFYYGFLLPNTRYAKLGTGVGAAALAAQGLRYLRDLALHDPGGAVLLLFLPAAALAPLGAGARRGAPSGGAPTRAALLGAGGVLYVVYVVLIGGDFMAGRHWAAPVFLGALLAARELASLADPARLRRAAAALALALAAAAVLAPAPRRGSNPGGVLDERATYAPTNSLWANLGGVAVAGSRAGGELRAMAEAAPGGEATVVAGFAVGAEGYFAGPGVRIVDFLGLCDPLLARLPVYDPGEWAPGHFVREIPTGYLAARRGGSTAAMDPDLARYWERLRFVVSGPLWSLARLRTALAFNLGAFDGLRERYLAVKRGAPVPLGALAGAPAGGERWDAPGVVAVPTRHELVVEVAPPRAATAVEMSARGTADYELRFSRGGELLGTALWRAVPADPGDELRTRVLALPPRVAASPFDAIVVRPRPRRPWISLSRALTTATGRATFSDYAVGRLLLR